MIMETKLKFKVGDRVRVKSLGWYNQKKDSIGHLIVLLIIGLTAYLTTKILNT